MGTDTRQAILVTGVGGNVGQGVLRILRTLDLPFRLVGTNTSLPCGGTHLCDALHKTPFATAPEFLEFMRDLCQRERVALILPCTDYEAYYLADAPGLPPAVTSPPATQRAFLDKLETWQLCVAAGVPFARSFLPSAYPGGFPATLVKPREGRGSRGIHVDPADPRGFDDSFVVQERIIGPEITVAFYVTRAGRTHGFIALERELGAGATMLCTVTHAWDAVLAPLIATFVAAFGVRGSCNIQAIVRANGEIVPFEVNGRISGTASIRHRLGFRDVEYAVREHLLHQPLPPVAIQDGTAVRLLMDVIYPGKRPDEVRDASTPHEVF